MLKFYTTLLDKDLNEGMLGNKARLSSVKMGKYNTKRKDGEVWILILGFR